jgi:CRISPR-associated protein Cmr1
MRNIMRTFEYTLRFNTPAFLGNAEQSGQWRTPPVKAQLRQWWRVAYAADNRFSVRLDEMRREEGLLFGIASDGEGDSRKSQIRIRLDRWDVGQLKQNDWPRQDGRVPHPEVKNRQGETVPVGSQLYLGYGPLEFRGGGTGLKHNAAIQFGESATLSLAMPEAHAPLIQQALWLMDRYGSLGGRSRNGWGSFALLPLPQAGEGRGEGQLPQRPLRECLSLDWPHALGQDAKGPLIWQTVPHDDWKTVMKTLAMIKIGLRTQKPLFELVLDASAGDKPTKNGINHGQPQHRHWLSYPVTNHSVKSWGGNARLPNQLRFKVRPTPDGKLVGLAFHVPHRPPSAFNPDPQALERVWTQVHRFLDTQTQQLTRIGE